MARPRVGPKLAEETLVRLVRQSELLRIPAADTCSTSWPRPRCVVPDGPGERSCTVFALQRLTSSFPVHNASRPMGLGRLRWTCNKLYPQSHPRPKTADGPSVRSLDLDPSVPVVARRSPATKDFVLHSRKPRNPVLLGLVEALRQRALPAATLAGVSIATARLPHRFDFCRVIRGGSNAVSRLDIGATHHNRNRTTVLDPCQCFHAPSRENSRAH